VVSKGDRSCAIAMPRSIKPSLEVAAILGDALVRLLFPESADFAVDLPETESPHVTAG